LRRKNLSEEGKGEVIEAVEPFDLNKVYEMLCERLRTMDDKIYHVLDKGKGLPVDKPLEEAIGQTSPANAVPEIWSSDIQRCCIYGKSYFWGSPHLAWHDDIRGGPGDTINLITVGKTYCGTMGCEEPTSTAATIGKVPVTLVQKQCSYKICRTDLEDVVPQTITAINDGLGDCLSHCIDQYMLAQLQVGVNAGTLTAAALGSVKLSGSVIARAIGSVRAGTCEPVALFTHPIAEASLLMDTQFTNAATFGNRDVIAGGKVRNYMGVDIYALPQGTLQINGSLGVAGSGTIRSVMVAKNAFAVGRKRDVGIESEYYAKDQVRYVIASVRFGATIACTDGVFWIHTVDGG
jgi:hypothetical protein